MEDGVGEAPTERRLNVALSEHVYGAPDGEIREAFGTDANGLAVIDKGDRGPLDGTGDSCGFAVIEGLGCGPADEVRELRHARVSESGLLDEMLFAQRGKSVGIFSPRASTGLKLQRDLFDDDTSVGQGAEDRLGTSSGVQIDDDAGVGDDGRAAFIEAISEDHPCRFH